MMELQGLGMEDAAKTLIVSKAVRRAMKDQGFSAIEAIDDLTAKLCVANLLQSASPEKHQTQTIQQRTPIRRAISSQTIVQSSQRKLSARKTVKSKLAKVKVDSKASKIPRKRPCPGSDDKLEPSKSRTRADSVAEEVNAKIATQIQPSDARPPVAPKGKRAGVDVAAIAQQPASKRPREV